MNGMIVEVQDEGTPPYQNHHSPVKRAQKHQGTSDGNTDRSHSYDGVDGGPGSVKK
jgi:hypothetical protein